MNGFFDWFKSSTKIKRWIFLVLLGMLLFCFAFTNILFGGRMEVQELILSVVAFVLGFTFSVLGLIFIQKRNLEIIIEASEKKDNIDQKNVNIKSLIFNKKVYEKGPNIVVIGGGTGITPVLKGLKNYTSNIKAIVAVSDYGKNPTFSRQALEVLPTEDIRNSITALSDENSGMKRLLDYEFKDGRLQDLNFGDIYFHAMEGIYGNFSEAIDKSSEILNITGEVFPVTLDEMKICAELEDGTIVEEKDKISEMVYDKITKIKRVFISPTNCKVAPGVLDAIKNADAIIIGPGSLYTNVIPNLLIKNVSKTIKESKAMKIYVSNIMTEPGQTDNYSLYEHIQALENHANEQFINYCICDTGEIVPEFIRMYNKKGSDVVEQDYAKVRQKGIVVIPRNLSCVQGKSIRHDFDLVAASIIELICNELRFKDKQNEMKYMLLDKKLKKQKKENPKLKNDFIKLKNDKKTRVKAKSKFGVKYSDRIKSIKGSAKKGTERTIKDVEEIKKPKSTIKKRTTATTAKKRSTSSRKIETKRAKTEEVTMKRIETKE